jgi:hypothetical protein
MGIGIIGVVGLWKRKIGAALAAASRKVEAKDRDVLMRHIRSYSPAIQAKRGGVR